MGTRRVVHEFSLFQQHKKRLAGHLLQHLQGFWPSWASAKGLSMSQVGNDAGGSTNGLLEV